MAFIDKLKEELDRAGKAAQGALDEGKTRLEAFRARQLADKAAQALGYAVFRAKKSGSEVDADTYTRLSATLETHDSEAARYEADIERRRRESSAKTTTADTGAPAADAATTAGAAPADKAPSGASTATGKAKAKPTDSTSTAG
jgi:hypothetical protein